MSKELFVTSTPHETKLAIVEDDQVVEVYFERENEYTLAGSIYKGKVTRVLPGMQSAFVEVGLERDAFLYVTDFVEGIEEDHDDDEVTAKPEGGNRESQPREERQGREGRGGFRERRRHPRGGQQGRQQERQADSSSAPVEFGGDFTTEENIDANEQTDMAVANALTHSDETVSAEPADDNGPSIRRWRGRRGRRRRGRGNGAQGGELTENASAETLPETEEPGFSADEAQSEQEIAVEAEESTPEPQAAESFERESRPDRSERRPRPERSEPRTGSRERTLLPGESLKKYGGGTTAPESSPRAAVPRSANTTPLPRPKTLVDDPSAFAMTGSGVLAGETLRKYRERPAEPKREEPEEHHEISAVAEPQAGAPEDASTSIAAPLIAEREGRHETLASTTTHEFSGDFTGEEEETVTEHHAHSEPVAVREEKQSPASPDRYGFAPGSGEVEEELIDEEEQEMSHYSESMEEGDLEELEEETLEMDEEASHEDEMIAAGEKIAAAFAEARRPEAARTFEEEEEEEGEEESAEGEEDSAEMAEDDSEFEESEEPAEVEEGRAEVRASSGTAGFQQRAERDRNRDRGRRGGRRGRSGGRPPMRSRRNIPRGPLPQINELLKEGQEILVQIAKEPMAKKGARITSHIALPGRFLVFMPTVNHTGVSRKIGSDEERRRLKHILLSEKGDAHGGFIVRTAAAGASEEELRSDIRFLINLWNEIKQRSESSKAPALIYHDLNLVERILRDQVTANFTSIWVDSEAEYERILRFAQRFQPSLIKRVKLYSKDTPLFEQFGVQDEINKALKSKVWLKSGGYIVINQTEALVAIDINTGKFVGKTSRLEDTIVKTNIDAIQEIVRQIRLRDLGGIIIIDFIDMDERRNRQKVMQALEEALRSDRSPTKVLQFNDFGLVAITRKRVKQSLERTLSTQCGYCTGTGMVKSVPTVCNEIYVELRKMHKQLEGHQVMLRVNPEVAKGLKENAGRWLTEMEELIGKTIIVKSDPAQHQEQFDIQ